MTDRMSNIEIEDVLSSIRRLVSDDLRPGAAMPAAAPVAPRPAVPRLVLTAALRVPADPLREAVAAPQEPAPEHLTPEPEFAEPEPQTALSDDGLAGRLADLEALMAGQGHSFDDQDYDDEGTAPVVLRRPVPSAPETEEPTQDLAEELAEDEAPFLSDDDAPSADAFVWTDPAPRPSYAPEDDDPVSLLDEAVLRDLIRDVLREELQGAMGERVTRNLRKLVRAEISRALTARGIA